MTEDVWNELYGAALAAGPFTLVDRVEREYDSAPYIGAYHLAENPQTQGHGPVVATTAVLRDEGAMARLTEIGYQIDQADIDYGTLRPEVEQVLAALRMLANRVNLLQLRTKQRKALVWLSRA